MERLSKDVTIKLFGVELHIRLADSDRQTMKGPQQLHRGLNAIYITGNGILA